MLLCTRCLKPCLHGVRLQPLAKPSSRRKEAQGENALCLRAEVSVSDKCRGRLERRVRYDRNMFFVVPRKATLYIELTLIYISNERLFDEITLNHHRISVVLQGHFRATDKPLFLYLKSGESLTATSVRVSPFLGCKAPRSTRDFLQRLNNVFPPLNTIM